MALRVFKKLSFAFWSVFLGGLLLCSCNQDPIFYGISLEVEPVDPRIVGMPTHIVSVGNTFYVATKFSKTIQCYNGKTGWNELPRPGDPIMDLAATESYVYALTGEPGSTGLYKWEVPDEADSDETAGNWESVANAAHIQSIYGAKDTLFACAMTDTSTFTMLNDNSETLQALTGGSGFLQEAAYNNGTYYLAGTGIYTLTGVTLTLVPGTEGLPMAGLITLKDNTVAGVSGKKLLFQSGGAFKQQDMGVTFTGAMALWEKKTEQDEKKTLLLLGMQGSSTSTTHGYREILLSNGSLNPDNLSLRTPGTDPSNSSVSNYDKYNSSLGKHPVMTLFQAADGTLFAGTTKNGLWSYRNEQWNAEP